MPMRIDEEYEQRERDFELQRLAITERDRAAHRRHEEEKLRLKIELANKQKSAVNRLEAVQRILLAIVKLPMLPLVLAVVWALLRREREVPQYLTDYLNL